MDLGADGFQTFRYVTLPVVATALVAGGLLAFALSFDEVIVTTFTAGAQNTLPLWIFGNIRLGQQLPQVNVVVLFVPYRNSGFRDVTGAVSPEAVLEGGGDAWFFADGKVVRGRWARPGIDSPFSLSAPDGTVPVLTPGQTFVELAPGPGSATVVPAAVPSTTTTSQGT